MDRREEYKAIVKQFLLDYGKIKPAYGDINREVVFDEERGHYELLSLGWKGTRRVHHTLIHIDIKDGKIWLQQNLTEQNPAEELVAMGVPREDIILGLQPPYKRQYTDYGVA